MSQDDSSAATSSTATAERTNRRDSGKSKTPLIIGVVLALVAALVAFFLLNGDDEGENSANCVTDEVSLAVAPAMKDLLGKAVKDVEAEEECITFKVSEGTVKDVVAILNDPDGKMPDLWVPDSPTWQGQLTAAGWSGTPIVDVIAQTPVGLVSGPAAKPPASWTESLESGRLAMADPSAEGASALALLAPFAEMKQTGKDATQLKEMAVPLAQAFGERTVDGEDTSTDLSTISATSTQLVPVTEQAFLKARRGNDQLTLVAPKSGVPMMQFPIIDVNKGSGDLIGGARSDHGARAGRALAHWFSSSEGQEAVVEAEFRPAGARELEGVGMGQSKVLPRVPPKVTDEALRNWRVTSVPSSLLAVMDLSASMRNPIGDTTRIKMATDAAYVALDVLPDHARVGSWGFSKKRGKGGRSWQEMMPLTRLDEDVNGTPFRELLRADTLKLPSRVRGGTGVLDTLLAAYTSAQEQWDPAYFNAVVVFTDGASDDTSNLTIERLLENLRTARDPSRPVKVVIIGISEDADTPEMQQIADATGGQYFLVTKPDDILGVLYSALQNR